MATEATHDLVANYWVPVSQLIPVFALALVFEARRLASTWTVENRLQRGVLSLVLGVTAYLMYTVESWSLSAMAKGDPSPDLVYYSNLAIYGVMTGLAVQPIINIVIAGNAEVIARLQRLVPGTSWRRAKKQLEEGDAQLTELIVEVLRAEKEATEEVDRLRAVKDKLRVRIGRLEEIADQSDLPTADLAPLREEVLEERDHSDKLLGETEELLKQAKKKRKKVRRTLHDADRLVKAYSDVSATYQSTKLTEEEVAQIKHLVELSAGRSRAAP